MSEPVEPTPTEPPEPGAAPDASASDTAPPPRPALRAASRWGTIVLVFALLAGGVAYGVTQSERDDVPGLATESDGRWDYPRLKLPALPSGSPRPFTKGNPARIHHADIRDLLLPAPRGAKADKALPDIDGGWVSEEDYLSVYVESERPTIQQRMADSAPRHIAARGWTMPDGTRTRIYLLRFNTGAYPKDLYVDGVTTGMGALMPLRGAENAVPDKGWPKDAKVPNVRRHAYDEEAPRGKEHHRQAYLVAGDTLALIVQSRPGTARKVPFQQTVILQSQLLG
ncbi:hypothetical protein LHJ74_23465 [Streptomyces sp. N2-109]|uniref:Uncharacterized protein n=1 Tax=Streptomyces gossypii TaxID=2883101 RepID=A0ABT2JY71_9ACTN|nr:hypothetical protein [Streptomyces gossypii]MCT2592835.1 hypothetical protein [Streptomyces gossypii]